MLLLRNIDLEKMTVEAFASKKREATRYLKLCSHLGIREVSLLVPPGCEGQYLAHALSSLRARGPCVRIKKAHAISRQDRGGGMGRFRYRLLFEPNREKEHPPIGREYEMDFHNVDSLVKEVDIFVFLAAHSLPLPERAFHDLRFCTHELATNTAEHGRFPSDRILIRLSMLITSDTVSICYMDNGEPFATVKEAGIDIATKMNTRIKRGLGLYLINRLSSQFAYHRRNEWNVTRFAVHLALRRRREQERREIMNEFKIEVIPCDRKDAVVLKPIGSIDSAAVEQFESQISSFMGTDKRILIIDFSRVDFISSSGIGVLLGTVTTLRAKGGDLILMSVPKQIRNVFDILNMGDYFVTVDTWEELKSKL